MMDLEPHTRWIMAISAILSAVAVGYLIRLFVIHRIAAIVSRTQTSLDDALLAATRRQIPMWFLLGGLVVAARVAPLSERALLVVDRIASVGLVISLCWAASTLGTDILGRYTREAGTSVATTSLTQNVLRILVFLTGGLLVLANLGISITPLLTALGVGSLAVALALQPTLSNLFAGLHLAIARPLGLGDYVALENGMKGFVDDIGWRTTQLRSAENNIIIVPNARVVDMIVTNFSKPQPEQTVTVEMGVSHRSDLHRVERLVEEVATGVLMEIPGGVATHEPVPRYTRFTDSDVRLTVVLRIGQYSDGPLLVHEFIKRIKERFDREGIPLPLPRRIVHVEPEGAPPAGGRGVKPSS